MKTTIYMMCLCLMLPAMGCAGRQPTSVRSEKMITRYFNRYAKKYQTSSFGPAKVTGVSVLNTEELHKHYVHVNANVSLSNGQSNRVRVAIEKKLPLGWKIVAWESE